MESPSEENHTPLLHAGLESEDEQTDNSDEDGSGDNDGEGQDEHDSEEDEDEEDEEDKEDEEDEDERVNRKIAIQERSSSFKAWANQQRNEALGFTPTTNTDTFTIPKKPSTATATTKSTMQPTITHNDSDGLTNGLTAASPETSKKRNIYNVAVSRNEELQETRSALPVVAEEQKIMEAVHNNDCTVIWGATGSGKTTQIPQFLYEAGYGSPHGPTPGLIGVTQPRRVAAVSMAKRVAVELGDQADRVAYQIRFDSTVGPKTAIKFMTDGVLLREIAQDFTLSKYSAIVIDEAHERSVNTDLLIGMLSRIVETREDLSRKNPAKFRPLKLIIMSATLRISDYCDNKALFRRGPPPVVQAEGRQYPVTIHFARKTQREYGEEVFHKVSKGHKKLPPGGMLVFMTGQNEITTLVKRLREAFPSTQGHGGRHPTVQVSASSGKISGLLILLWLIV